MDSMRRRFVSVTTELLDDDPDLAVVLADISADRFAASGAVERHPDRVINVGIREQLLVGVAAGLALEGFRPIAHSYAPFLVERPFEQIKLDLGHQDLAAVLVSIGASYDAADSGRTHQAPEDVMLLATLPDWEIHIPGHPNEAEALLRHAVGTDGSVYLRLSESANGSPRPVAPGRLHVVRAGGIGSPTVVTVGPMLDSTLAATEGLEATLLYATTVRPFDAETLRRECRGEDVILVEPTLEGTSSAVVSEALNDRPHRILAMGVPRHEHRHYGSPAEHDAAHGLDAAGIRRRIHSFLFAGG